MLIEYRGMSSHLSLILILFIINNLRHPHSIDALCTLPSTYPSSHSTVLTGSSDGLLRAVQLLPTKLLGVVADHGEFPIERIEVDMGGEGRWVGSVGHEEVLKLTDLKEVFEDEESEEEGPEAESGDEGSDEEENRDRGAILLAGKVEGKDNLKPRKQNQGSNSDSEDSDVEESKPQQDEKESDNDDKQEAEDQEQDSTDDEAFLESKKRKKKDKDPMKIAKRKKGKNEVDAEPSFFADL